MTSVILQDEAGFGASGSSRLSRRKAGRRSVWVSGFVLFVILIGLAGFAALNWFVLSIAAQVLVLGLMALMGLMITALIILINSVMRDDGTDAEAQAMTAQAFEAASVAQLITQGDQVIRANRAYRQLAEEIGTLGEANGPPTISRLFAGFVGEEAMSLFRLTHLGPDQPSLSETVRFNPADGAPRDYVITVSRLEAPDDYPTRRDEGGCLLWQIERKDIQDDTAETLIEVPVGLCLSTVDGRVLRTNDTLQRWMGGPDVLAPAHINEFIDDPDILLGSDAAPGKTVRADTRLITRKGVVTPVVMIANWRRSETDGLVASIALHGHTQRAPAAAGVNAQLQAGDGGASLDQSRAISHKARDAVAALSVVPFGLLHVDGETLHRATVSYANEAFAVLSGRGETVGLSVSDIFEREGLLAAFKDRDAATLSKIGALDVRLSGPKSLPVSLYIVKDPVVPDRHWFYLVDISARKSLEDQVHQSQKMQAIGQLTAGVAHDFNNMLQAIRLNTDELLQRHPVGDPSYPELQSINATGARAAALVKKLLAFSRQQTRRPERFDVGEALSDMYLTLKQTLGGQAQLQMNHGRDLPPVLMDRSQFDNVIMNLCVNARDAMEAQGGGLITIASETLDRQSIENEALRSAVNGFAGDEIVRISVSDTGTGMTDAVKAKIFEPFFTTKDQGKGTGLGLATVYGVIQQSSGHLEVDSKLGEGTTFSIYLPRATEKADTQDEPAVVAPAQRKPADLAGTGNILFVEDEASVRVIAAKSLRKKGYTVTEAEDGEEALEILEDAPEPFDLLLSDVVMPELDGPGLLKQGRQYLGDARIVFISGYAEEKFSELLAEEPDVTFLPKPFTLAELAEKVKSEIGEAR